MNEALFIWPRDNAGNLINLGEQGDIQADFKPAVLEASHLIRSRYGDTIKSIFLRGSASIGAAVPYKSDLDLIVITSKACEDVPEIGSQIASRYPFIEGADVSFLTEEQLSSGALASRFQVHLVTQSKLIFGQDHRRGLTLHKPDRRLAWSLHADLQNETERLTSILSGDSPPHYRGFPRDHSFWAKWSMRVVLRSSQLLAMLDTKEYSSHLYTCWFLSRVHFRPFRTELDQVFEVERQYQSDPVAALQLMDWFRAELIPRWSQGAG